MNKKTILIASSILATTLLIGSTFAAYAVTDSADPFGINVTPGTLDQDTTTKYVTLSWGSSTSLNTIENAQADTIYKLGVINLKSSKSYTGKLSINLTDETTARSATAPHFIDYLKLYLYEGPTTDVEEGNLPSGSALASTSLQTYSLLYNAVGTSEGKEYSIYVEVDASADHILSLMDNDVVDIQVDWSAKDGDQAETNKTIYFTTDWSSCYLYAWNSKGCNQNYPGIEMDYIGNNQYDQKVYRGTLIDGYEKILFDNGSNDTKTKDLPLSSLTAAFALGDPLFWQDSSELGVGYKAFEESDVCNYAANLGKNPGPILQAWDWTIADVTSRLDNIVAAGFKAVQLSPLQPLKTGSSTSQVWSMAYQPLGFEIATGNNTNPYGNKDSLTALCATAKAKGVDIIVDLVANHLAEGSKYGLDSGVQYYESVIYSNNLIHNNSEYGETNDSSTQSQVRGNLGGLPDLMTEDTRVQDRVKHLIKEYIDCGVSGFRFDAAKHIETSADGYYGSDFWRNVISYANECGIKSEKVGKFPYCYGEVLGVGGRSWYGYTQYIDVTDYGLTWQIRDKFNNHDEGGIRDNSGYTINNTADYALVYAESHDNFCHGDTTSNTDDWIDAQYGWHASRANSSSLYFARPIDSQRHGNETNIVVTPTEGYHDAVVSAANKLHNDFNGGSEYLSAWGGCAINVREYNSKVGAYILCPYDSTQVTIKLTYGGGYVNGVTLKDLVTGTIYSNVGEEMTINMTNHVAVLVQQ